jgi:copper chaperone CopZ
VPSEKIAVLKVDGMHCQSCADAIGGSLRSLKGVKEAKVEFAKSKATVRFDPGQTDSLKVRKAIEGAGYRVA